MENKGHLTHRSQCSKWVAERAAANSERFSGYLSGAETHQGCGSLDSPSACGWNHRRSPRGFSVFYVTDRVWHQNLYCTKMCHLGKWLRETLDTHFLWLLEGLVMNWGSLWVLPGFPSVSELQGLRPSGQTLQPLYLTISSPTCTQLQGLLRQGGHQREVLPLQIPVLLFSKPGSGNLLHWEDGMWPSFLEG